MAFPHSLVCHTQGEIETPFLGTLIILDISGSIANSRKRKRKLR